MKNRMYIGILVGTIFPLIFGTLVKLIFYKYIDFDVLISSSILKSTFLQFGIIGNLLLFYIYMIKNKKEEQKGIVLPTLIYFILALIFKFY